MKTEIILASKSAIRKQMLDDIGIPYEVIVSNADETPDLSKSFEDQLADISMRKAKVIFDKTIDRGNRIIVAAEQNIVFNGKMYVPLIIIFLINPFCLQLCTFED